MLFDLRGRGRRRTIQVIYVTLAILMGGGLVFFGIGGNSAGGLFDALGLTGGGNSTVGGGANDVFARQISQAEKQIKVNPNDSVAWETLAKARFQQAGQSGNFDQKKGQFTDKGRQALQGASTAWQRYLALNPPKPDDTVATLMVQAYSPAGLNDPTKGVKAAEIVTQSRPSAQGYYQLAVFAYAANDKRRGDLASAKTLALTPAARKTQTKLLLDQAKKPQASAGGVPAPAPTSSATGR
jgi:hypothetical protein